MEDKSFAQIDLETLVYMAKWGQLNAYNSRRLVRKTGDLIARYQLEKPLILKGLLEAETFDQLAAGPKIKTLILPGGAKVETPEDEEDLDPFPLSQKKLQILAERVLAALGRR